MSIASGYKKFKKYILTSSGFQLVSHWTKANTLEFDDGKTAQDKLGAIDGISSSRESNSDKIAASTALVSELNSDLGGVQFISEGSGADVKYYAQLGADSASKKELGSALISLGTGNSFDLSKYKGYKNFTPENNFILRSVKTIINANQTDSDSYNRGYNYSGTINPSLSYNSTTGIINITGTSISTSLKSWGNTGAVLSVSVVCEVLLYNI
mgnify:CR=1 FL=1